MLESVDHGADDQPKEDNKALGVRLRTLREQASLTQAEMAEIVGKSRSAVAKFENGTPPGRTVLSRYSKHFAVNTHWLLTGAGDQYLAAASEPASDMEKQLIDAFRRLPENEAAQWLGLLMTRLKITNN